jgi:hypothetical protein
MEITVSSANGKHYAEVGTAYRTPDYLTPRMALADAMSWLAFHGPADALSLSTMRVYRAGLAMRAKMDAEATVTVSSGTHVLPWEMVAALREGTPDPRHTLPGSMGARMRARQRLFRDAAALLVISPAEARRLPALLRANLR